MRKYHLLSVLTALLFTLQVRGQEFSNKGKDFWVAYGFHQSMTSGAGGGSQNMVLYFAAEQNTNVTVSIPGVGYTQNYFVPANSVVSSNIIPKSGAQDVRLVTESGGPENKGIHITADKPVVAYAHIYNQSVSGASILFPTNTLGREYYSVNYTNNSNTANSNSWFYVIAADTGTTVVEIIPSANTLTHPAGIPFTVSMTQGQVFNLMGQYAGFSGVDLTGSQVRSISASGACKKIAVYSGSGRINITCNGPSSSASSDNYMTQAFPKTAWGKKYLTVPAAGGNSFNIYRVCVSDPATNVKVNGFPVPYPLVANFYYEIPATNLPQSIEADKPIFVSQYFTSQNQCGNSTNGQLGDPETIYLSSIEQNINKVLWNATSNFSIGFHYFNVVVPNSGTGLTSFKLDGASIPANSFVTHPQDPKYSYLIYPVNAGQHIIESDSGFNAIAYGFGAAESYGYNAGTNIKDHYRFISTENQYGAVDRLAATCVGVPFTLSMTFPYQPTQLIWLFGGLFPNDTINNPVFSSTSVENGVTLYRYTRAGTLTASTAGTYPIRILAQNPTADGCNGIQEMEYELTVYDKPVADFNFTSNGCVSNPVLFTENVNTGGRPISQRHWNFGDGNTATNVATASHTYGGPGSYLVKYAYVTDIGCKTDTAEHTVALNDPPVAAFSPVGPFCAGKQVTFNDNSSVATGSIGKWTWNFGDGSPAVIHTVATNPTHSFAATGTFTVTLQVETSSGCVSTLSSQQVSVHPNPVVSFDLPNVCLPAGTAQFNSTATIADGSEAQLGYLWDFGDASPTSTIPDPVHQYTATGPFNVALTVTSNNGCATAQSQSLTTIYNEPKAIFTPPAEVCLGASMNFTESSSAPGSTVTGWAWDFGDGTNSTAQNPSKTYSAPGNYTVTLSVTSAIGCSSVSAANIATHTVTVNALPSASFDVSLPACIGIPVTFTSTSVPNSGNLVKWTWNFGDAFTLSVNYGDPVTHTYHTAGTFQGTLQVETDKGCVSAVSAPQDLPINVQPQAGFIVPEICVSDNFAPFTDTSKVSGGSIVAWEWNFGDPNANASNPNTSSLQNPTHHYTLPGAYTAQLIATSNSGCKDTIPQTVNVNGALLTPQFSVENTTALCSNSEIVIKDASTIDAGTILRVEIYWDPADPGNKTVDDSPALGKTYSHTYAEFGSPATKDVTIIYEVWSGINCVTSIPKTITLLATPQLAFGAVLPICDNQPAFNLTQAQLLNGLPGTGLFTGTGITSATDGTFDPTIAGAGTHDIMYTFTADNGCIDSVPQSVVVNPTPVADAGPDRFLLEGGFIALTPTIITSMPVTYLWSPGTYLDDPNVASPKASPPIDFTYQLTVTSDQGCVDDDEVTVTILKNLVIPNIFSPNGDNINDKWVIEHLDSYPGCTIQLFNRYGQMVQRFVNYTPWDGKINGKDAPIGTYYYIIDPKNGRKPMTGFVDIIR